MIFEQFSVGNMQNFVYLFANEQSREGFIVDPAFDQQKILEKIKAHKINLTRIILTHHHFDHVNAANQVKSQTGAEIICHRETAPLLHGAATADRLIDDNYSFNLGADKISFLHTPGHAPGSVCLLIADKWLVTGDTLFINDCGRADLPGSDPKVLYESLQRLKTLPDHLLVCAGHDYGPQPMRTLGEEKRCNPVLTVKSYADF